ncbi:MAG: aminoacyl-tRNA hydrolase [Fusobacteria bacterium]|jgi:PTH1 family peptidyl-tRNA hydrolase|nr:aminoacyl-tRNA hydrolase [Fusobacteriota bacterium]
MKIIVGLGNYGKEYEKTRHNIGFEVIKELADKLNISDFKKKFQGLIAETTYKNEKIILLMPTTFMNLSGNSIIEAINFYKLDSKEDIIVIYDDMDLPLGKMKIKKQGSAGGHNGIKSIISHMGTQFYRIKCGIDKPTEKGDTINYVLGKFSKLEESDVKNMINKAVEASLELIFETNKDKVIGKYN